MNDIKFTKPRGIIDWLRLFALYRTAFPRSERKPFSIIRKTMKEGKGDVWCVERGGRFAGLAFTINSEHLVLLDYFAVSKKHRGEGIGTAVLVQLMEHYGDRGFFLEIESTLTDAPDLKARQKRKHFYLAAGLKPLNVEAILFDVRMELLGIRCSLDFDGYQAFYREQYSIWAAKHIEPVEDSGCTM
ncbi:MAG: GNAT family N-acetyltransferase [Oscillospiraceae bacterium]|nr:GNAT family N-acetyltransferase [Oscillospiraceae bacterium]